jgi:hypothetical protein
MQPRRSPRFATARGRLCLFAATAVLAAGGSGCLQILGDDYETREPEPPPPDPPPVCEEEPTCDECLTCALENDCEQLAADCYYPETPCGAYFACNTTPPCEDFACDAQCTADHPEGAQHFDTVLQCSFGICDPVCN